MSCHRIGPCPLNFALKAPIYESRRSYTLNIERFSSFSYGRNSITYQGISLWHKLPENIRCIVDIKTFKEALGCFLINDCDCQQCRGDWGPMSHRDPWATPPISVLKSTWDICWPPNKPPYKWPSPILLASMCSCECTLEVRKFNFCSS